MFTSHYVQCYSKRDAKWKPGLLKGRDEHGRYVITVRDANPDSPGLYNPKIDVEANDGNYIEKEIYLYPTLIRDSLEPWVTDDRVPPPTFTWNLEDRMAASLAANKKQREDWAASSKAAIEASEKKAAMRDHMRKQEDKSRWNLLNEVQDKQSNDRMAGRSFCAQEIAEAESARLAKMDKSVADKEAARANAATKHNSKIAAENRRREDARRKALDEDAAEKQQIAGTYEKINRGINAAEAARANEAAQHAAVVREVEAEKAMRRKAELERLDKQEQEINASYAKINDDITQNEQARAVAAQKRAEQLRQLEREKEERRQKELQRQAVQQENTGAGYSNINSNLSSREQSRQQEQQQHAAALRDQQAKIAQGRQEALEEQAKEQEKIRNRYSGVNAKLAEKENQRKKDQFEHQQKMRAQAAKIAQGRQEALEAQAAEREAVASTYNKVNENLSAKERERQQANRARAQAVAAKEKQTEDDRQARMAEEAAARNAFIASTYDNVNQKITKKQQARLDEQSKRYQDQREHQARIAMGRAEAVNRQQKQNDAVAASQTKVQEKISAKEAKRQEQNRQNTSDLRKLEEEQAMKRQQRLEQNEKEKQAMAATYNKINDGMANKESDKRAAENEERQRDGENNLNLLKRKSDQNDKDRANMKDMEARREEYKNEKANARSAKTSKRLQDEEQTRREAKAKHDVPGSAALFGSGATVSPKKKGEFNYASSNTQGKGAGMVPADHTPLQHAELSKSLIYNTPCDIYSTKTGQWVKATYLAYEPRMDVYRTRLPNGRTVITPRNRIRPASGDANKVYADEPAAAATVEAVSG